MTQTRPPTHSSVPKTGVIELTLARWARPALAFYWPTLAIATHWPRLDMPNPSLGIVNTDKILHAGCFALLAILMIYARLAGRSARLATTVWVGTLIAATYAIVDELTQGYFDRTISFGDLAANLIGVSAIGVLLWLGRFPRSIRLRDVSFCPDIKLTQSGNADPDPTTHTTRFVGHAVLVAAFTFLSRILGLIRDAVLAACFGLTSMTDAFWIAFVIPNLFRRLFGEGALSAAFIPAYTALLRKDRAAAGRFAWICVSLLLVMLAAVVLTVELVLAWLLDTYQWSDDTQLAVRLTMIMLPYTPMICAVALLGGVLQVHHRFGPPAAAPILLNLVMIAATVLATLGVQSEAGLRPAITLVALSVLVGGLLQLAWQFVSVLQHERFILGVAGTGSALKSMLRTMLPMVLGLAVFQINTLFDSLIAWGLSPKTGGATSMLIWDHEVQHPIQQGAVTALQYAQRLYQFPLGVFGTALATAIFPALSLAAAGGVNRGTSSDDGPGDGPTNDFRGILQHGLRLTVFIGLPASAGLILIRLPLTRVIFEHHQFELADSIRVTTILTGYAAAVWAYSMVHVLTRAFYALKNARTPLMISIAMVALNVVLNLTLVWQLGVAALAWSTAICAITQAVLLIIAISHRIENPIDATVWVSWFKSVVLTGIMAGVILPVTMFYNPAELSPLGAGTQLVAMVATGIAIVFIGAKLIKAPELDWLLRRRIL